MIVFACWQPLIAIPMLRASQTNRLFFSFEFFAIALDFGSALAAPLHHRRRTQKRILIAIDKY